MKGSSKRPLIILWVALFVLVGTLFLQAARNKVPVPSVSGSQVVNIGVPREIHLGDTNPAYEAHDFTLNGDLSIVIDNGGNQLHRIMLERVSGPGGITISGANADSIEVKDVNVNRLTIRISRLREFDATGTCNIGNIAIEADDIDQISAWNGFAAATFDLKIGSSLRRLSLQDTYLQNLSIGPKEMKAYPQLREAILQFTGNVDDTAMSHASTTVTFNHLACSILVVKDEAEALPQIASVPSIAVWLEDIQMSDEKLIDVDIQEFEPRAISFRDISYDGTHHGSLTVNLRSPDIDRSNLEIAMVRGVDDLQLDWGKSLRGLMLRDVDANSVQLRLPPNCSPSSTVNIGGLSVRDGIDAPIEGILSLAQANSSDRPFDRPAFFRTIETMGYCKSENGSVVRAGLEALRLSRLTELEQRDRFQKVSGYLIYWTTGFGTTLRQPMCTLLAIMAVFTLIYAILFRSHHTEYGECFKLGFSTSIRATASLGTISKEQLLAVIPVSITKRDAMIDSILLWAHLQALLIFIQITLCSIFFSQTTLR